jgi:hypothetical protein
MYSAAGNSEIADILTCSQYWTWGRWVASHVWQMCCRRVNVGSINAMLCGWTTRLRLKYVKKALINSPAVKRWHPFASHAQTSLHKWTCWKSMYTCNQARRGMNKFVKNITKAVHETSGYYDDPFQGSWTHLAIQNWYALIEPACAKHETTWATEDWSQ